MPPNCKTIIGLEGQTAVSRHAVLLIFYLSTVAVLLQVILGTARNAVLLAVPLTSYVT